MLKKTLYSFKIITKTLIFTSLDHYNSAVINQNYVIFLFTLQSM